MTGPRESVLGRDIDACLGRFLMECQENVQLLKMMSVCKGVLKSMIREIFSPSIERTIIEKIF